MKAGFAQTDITPPVGVELCGFGPFLRRRSNGVYEQLYARAIAVEAGGNEAIIVSCDLIGLIRQLTDEARNYTSDLTGVPVEAIMVCCTHTHSGPATVDLIGWGEPDLRYLATLPGKIAKAANMAHRNLTEAGISIAEIKVDGFCYNRDYGGKPGGEKAGEPLDRKVTVFKFSSGEKLLGLASYFSVHPVVCCEETFKIHGDFVGVASNIIAREHEEVPVLFLQGACGDINSIYCHKPEDVSLKNLEKLASRYAQILRQGIKEAKPLRVDSIGKGRRFIAFKQQLPDRDELLKKIAEAKQTLRRDYLSEQKEQKATFQIHAYNAVLQKLDREGPPEMTIELQAIRIGELVFIGHPFELFNAIKKKVEHNIHPGKVFVVGYANDYRGYVPTEDRYELDGKDGREYCYAAYSVPVIRGDYCFDPGIGETLAESMTELYYEVISK